VVVTWSDAALSMMCVVFAYLDILYPDLSVNFMAAKNLDISKWQSGCCGCLQKSCKLGTLYNS